MLMRSLLTAAAIAAFALPAGAQNAGVPATAPAHAAKPAGALPPDIPSRVVMEDADGKPIEQPAFDATLRGGQRYVSRIDGKSGAVVLRLLPRGDMQPGSFAPTDMQHLTFSFMTVAGVHYIIELHDPHGRRIDEAAFTAGAARGQRYLTTLDRKNRVAILTLLPIGVNKAGSQPTSTWAQAFAPDMTAIPKPGAHFAAFDLPGLGGGRIDSASLAGKPYVVDFFFAECVGCIAELPVLNAWHRQHPEQAVIAITFDDAGTAADFVKQHRFDWPVAYAGKAFTDKLGIKVYPTLSVVGADGTVLATRVGSDDNLTPAKLEKWIAASLDGTHQGSARH